MANKNTGEVIKLETNLTIGLHAERKEVVTSGRTAIAFGSGSVAVYATPAMVTLMETASVAAVDPLLPAGFATVGTDVTIKHLAATPVGMTIKATAELLEIDGKRLVFKIEAFDDNEKIGSGTHDRYIIYTQKFIRKSEAKRK